MGKSNAGPPWRPGLETELQKTCCKDIASRCACVQIHRIPWPLATRSSTVGRLPTRQANLSGQPAELPCSQDICSHFTLGCTALALKETKRPFHAIDTFSTTTVANKLLIAYLEGGGTLINPPSPPASNPETAPLLRRNPTSQE